MALIVTALRSSYVGGACFTVLRSGSKNKCPFRGNFGALLVHYSLQMRLFSANESYVNH